MLDCLTGHKKTGLSGSIKISAAASSSDSSCSLSRRVSPFHHHRAHSDSLRRAPKQHDSSQQPSAAGSDPPPKAERFSLGPSQTDLLHTAVNLDSPEQNPRSERNLKVSIIPQNDHLIGHLTVYETLNYASKMKNCFDRNFNHKSNIKRIAQQLGLMSCLGTRINKLSGGQYKRVSIAQELLSSPDILILDEPTSGLDAMTCFQTVEVLKKLTQMDRKSDSQRQMAVILTIHQPNSDVFQQFNHVYVVAQGGKCIFEGPPANIEPMINQIGVRLPSSSYNPATLIVEVAAGKFGVDAIEKLNCYQRKQYEFMSVLDEQTSTGDSAVDCPSTASSISFGEEDNDDDDDDDHFGAKNASGDHNNNTQPAESKGLVNEGFLMDGELDGETNNNNNNQVALGPKQTGGDVIVLVTDSLGQKTILKPKTDQTRCDETSRRKIRRKTRRRSDGETETRPIGPKSNPASDAHLSALKIHHHSQPAMLCGPDDVASEAKMSATCGSTRAAAPFGGGNNPSGRDKRIKLNSLKADQKFPFWRHTYLHFHRSWLSIVRDPMLCSMQLALHIIVPLMVSLVYGSQVGKPNACPRAGPMDIMAYALEPEDSALKLQEDLRTTLENIGYIFFKLYGIIFAAMTVTVLTFPLDMHVLVKEFRNGWYGLSSYFLGRTLADIPFQLTLPLLAMSLSYYSTGQPSSYFQWRFLSITLILILSSLIAQSQGLLFGAILMDRMKAAVFVAPAATTPIILFAGFLVRTQSIPSYLRPLSNFSYLRYAIEACLISRYGFNQCECDPAVFNQTVPELPPIARSMLDYWLGSFRASSNVELDNQSTGSSSPINGSELIVTTLNPPKETPDLFTKLIDSLAKANSFGRNITSCEQVVPYPMIDYDLRDSQLWDCFAILLFMLVFTRLLTFFIVCFKVKRKV